MLWNRAIYLRLSIRKSIGKNTKGAILVNLGEKINHPIYNYVKYSNIKRLKLYLVNYGEKIISMILSINKINVTSVRDKKL